MTKVADQDTTALVTLRDWVRWAASRFNAAGVFFGHGTDNAIDEALALVLHAISLDHDLPEWLLSSRLTAAEAEAVRALVGRRVDERVPLPYLTGEARFAGLRFQVDERVLIPRSPLAEVIEQGYAPWLPPEAITQVLDLCTGSGCIALASAWYLPDARVDAVDLSAAALEVAAANCRQLGLEGRVRLLAGDLFAPLQQDALAGEGYDLIVSNPPYVGDGELASLPAEYRHEPRLALAADDDGLAVVLRLLRQAGRYLRPEGVLMVEVGNAAPLLAERLPEVPFLWLDFERGGDGVFMLTAEQLAQCQSAFTQSDSL